MTRPDSKFEKFFDTTALNTVDTEYQNTTVLIHIECSEETNVEGKNLASKVIMMPGPEIERTKNLSEKGDISSKSIDMKNSEYINSQNSELSPNLIYLSECSHVTRRRKSESPPYIQRQQT